MLSKWGNDLRQSYRTIAQGLEVSTLDIHLLMNHSLLGTNAGYITRDKLLNDLLRRQQERISRVVIEQAARCADSQILHWLGSSQIDVPVAERDADDVKLAA